MSCQNKPANREVARNANVRRGTAYIVKVALMAAMLTSLKLALAIVPNVEVVTVLIVCFGSAMGIAYALPATLIFCLVEMAIYGVGSWTLLYFVYWPLLAVLSSLLLRGKRYPLAIAIGIVGSVLFGVLSACCDTLFCVASLAPARLAKYWVAYYLRGLYFDLVHTISSAITIGVLYIPLTSALKRINNA